MSRKIYLTSKHFLDSALNELREAKFEIVKAENYPITVDKNFHELIRGSYAILCTEADIIDKDILNAAGPQLKIISTISECIDHIDVEECKRRNIIVTNDCRNSESVAEYAIGLLLIVGRRIAEASNFIKSIYWIEWKDKPFGGKVLKGSIVGFIGMRTFGLEILKQIIPFGVKSCYYHFIDGVNDVTSELIGVTHLEFNELLKTSDFVISCFNFDEHTDRIFNMRTFYIMKNDVVFIHIGRVELYQLQTLHYALINTCIGAAGLDIIFDKPLKLIENIISLPNVVISPYVSNVEFISHQSRIVYACQSIIRAGAGKKVNSAVY